MPAEKPGPGRPSHAKPVTIEPDTPEAIIMSQGQRIDALEERLEAVEVTLADDKDPKKETEGKTEGAEGEVNAGGGDKAGETTPDRPRDDSGATNPAGPDPGADPPATGAAGRPPGNAGGKAEAGIHGSPGATTGRSKTGFRTIL